MANKITNKPKILHLTLKKKWFDLVASGAKTVEYREFKDYWKKRLMDADGKLRCDFDEVHFRNGYSKDSPFMKGGFSAIRIIHTKHHVPVNDEQLTNDRYFAIYLGSVL